MLDFIVDQRKSCSTDVAEEPMPDDVLADLQEKLQEVMESTMENYDFDYQIEESQNILTHKLDELSGKLHSLYSIIPDFVTLSHYICVLRYCFTDKMSTSICVL
jgi:hypothetical protein